MHIITVRAQVRPALQLYTDCTAKRGRAAGTHPALSMLPSSQGPSVAACSGTRPFSEALKPAMPRRPTCSQQQGEGGQGGLLVHRLRPTAAQSDI